MKARWYQTKALDLIRKAFCDGHRKIMLFMATGSGKGFIFQELTKGSSIKGKKTLLLMRRRSLIFQSHERLNKIGIKNSVIMGNEKGFNPSLNVQVASIDTVAKRDNIDFLFDYDVLIVDECHDCTAPNYKEFLSKFSDKTIFIGLTASPFPVGNKVHDFWDACVKPLEIRDLVKEKYLTDCAIYVPSELDLTNIKTTGGDYNQKELGDKMGQLEIIGDVVSSYKKFGNNQAAICFAVNKDHSMKLAYEFNNNNIPAIHCDESNTQKERDDAISKLRRGEIKILCNVNIFSTGVDIPEAIVGILARPTKSEILYIQQVGRLLRPYRRCGKCSSGYDNSQSCPICGYDKPSFIKERAIIIDNANNIKRHGHPFKNRFPALKKEDIQKKKEAEKYEFKLKTCKACYFEYHANIKACPDCGHENEKVERELKKRDGTMVPYNEYEEILDKMNYYKSIQLQKGLKENFPFFKIYEDFGDVVFDYPDLKIPTWIPKVIEKNKEKEMQGLYK